jgi:replicative DNA helicase
MPKADTAFERGLPANLDAERYVLGSILIDPEAWITVSSFLSADDFSLLANQRIFLAMESLWDQGLRIERVSLAEELTRRGHLDSVGGLGYLVSLDEGLPKIFEIETYIKIVRGKSLLRRLILQMQAIIDRCHIAADPPEDILAEAENALLKISGSNIRDSLVTPFDIVEAYPNKLNGLLDPASRIKGISTGFVDFDGMTGGLRGGELVILAARPAMGKTALALNIGHYIATRPENPKTVALFSLEMSKEALLTRMICAAAKVDQTRFRSSNLEEFERKELIRVANALMAAPLYIDDSSNVSLMEMHAKLRRLKAERGLGLVIIDYLQLMSSRGRHENRVQEVSALSRGLKLLAKELDAPFLVLSQLSRAPETRKEGPRPLLSDLRESGSIEQDADLVCFVFREGYYKPDNAELRNTAELIIGKQRNGPVGSVKLNFFPQFTLFTNRTERNQSEAPNPHKTSE